VDCSGGDVTQVRIPEEAADHPWELLQPVERGQRLGFQILRACHTGTADSIVLDVLPHPLIRVQLRRIPRQEEQAQSPISGGGELLDGLGAVHRMTVQDQKPRTRSVVEQPTAEVNEGGSVQVAVVGGNRSVPLAATAEIRLPPNRSPVAATTGVWPTGAQVVPAG
jgi:hypothetical protein